MKVCLLTSSFPRYDGDFPGLFVYQLGLHLLDMGIDVVAVVPHENRLLHKENLGGIDVYRYPYFFPRSYQRVCYGAGIKNNIEKDKMALFQFPLFSIAQLFALVWVKFYLNVDVINSHWLIPQGFNAALLAKFFYMPHVCTVHAAGLFALRRIALGKNIGEFVTQNSDHLFVVSSYIKEKLDNLVGKTVDAEVLPMGIDVNRFNLDDSFRHSGEQYALLFVGRLVEKKGLQFLIEAMPLIIRSIPNIHLTIVGDGPLRSLLNKRVKKIGIDSHVSFLGRVSNNKMPSIYSKADLVVVPSVTDKTGETEGMPVVILEALAAGKPVIASNISGIPDIVKNGFNGYLVKPGSIKELAEIIVETFYQDGFVFSDIARETAGKYDWTVIARRYFQIFSQVVV